MTSVRGQRHRVKGLCDLHSSTIRAPRPVRQVPAGPCSKVISSRNPYECARVTAEGLPLRRVFKTVPGGFGLLAGEKETHTTPCSAEGPYRISSMNHALCCTTTQTSRKKKDAPFGHHSRELGVRAQRLGGFPRPRPQAPSVPQGDPAVTSPCPTIVLNP